MRLTYKEPTVYGGYLAVDSDEFACVTKLGQLEDIEDRLAKYKEIGIDGLIDLFKNLTDEDIEYIVQLSFKKRCCYEINKKLQN